MSGILSAIASNNTRFRTFYYNLYINYNRRSLVKRFFAKSWRKVIQDNINKPVKTTLHGFDAEVNCGFSYPLLARKLSQFNNPLVQLAYQTHKEKRKTIKLIDIGAAVGDTVFLLHSNLPDAFEKILCIDGDKEFFSYLTKNMKQFSFVQCEAALLSDTVKSEKSLVRIHAGTASAQGEERVQSITLDYLLLQKNFTDVDVLKIDTDGFDGKVLKGATNTLNQQKPKVIFEWHPLLINKTGNEKFLAFNTLFSCGYNVFLFYTKYGVFSHFMFGLNEKELEALNELSISNKFNDDWHYDVIALPDEDVLNIQELAECSFAKKKKSVY